MRNISTFVTAFLGVSSLVACACSSSKGNGGPGGGSAGAAGASGPGVAGQAGTGAAGAAGAIGVTISVLPVAADVLTCTSLQLSAVVTGTADTTVAWMSNGGPAAGTVSATGLYTAPLVVPSPNPVAVTATSVADPTKVASSAITLHEALPHPPVAAGESYQTYIAEHQMAAGGKSVYVVLPQKVGDSYRLSAAASADGGRTFGAPVAVSDVPDAQMPIGCTAIAVDAGDPNTVYVSYTIGAGVISSTADAKVAGSGTTLALAASTDGGAHFKNYVLESHDAGFGECPDITSPAPGTVVIETPAFGFPTPFLTTYGDETKGAGFAAGGPTPDGGWRTARASDVPSDFHDLAFDTDGEAPRLAGDGKGNLCVTYAGGYFGGAGDGKRRIAVQCSADSGRHFGAPVDVAIEDPNLTLHQPTLAFSPAGVLAVAYWVDLQAAGMFSAVRLAVSKDGGKTFAAPKTVPTYQLPATVGLAAKPGAPAPRWVDEVLWLAYPVADGAGAGRLVVDKSCDLGESWAGPILVNGPEPDIQSDLREPGILAVDGGPSVFAPKHASGAANDTYWLVRLAP